MSGAAAARIRLELSRSELPGNSLLAPNNSVRSAVTNFVYTFYTTFSELTVSEAIAKLFVNGGSQAVRLPKAFRFDGASEVLLKKDGDSVILTPRKRAPIQRMLDALKTFEKFPEREQPRTADKRKGL